MTAFPSFLDIPFLWSGLGLVSDEAFFISHLSVMAKVSQGQPILDSKGIVIVFRQLR